MGLFGKNKKEEEKKLELPQLPPLPKLPDFAGYEDDSDQLSQLPVFPSSPIGMKFSQNSIKRAISGEKEDDSMDADEFDEDEDEIRTMQKPLKRPMTEEMGSLSYPKPSTSSMPASRSSSKEPVFIRIDKFQDALKVFNETKRKIAEMEQMIVEIEKIKEKEQKELEAWENEVRTMKSQIEKIDQDIFSKI